MKIRNRGMNEAKKNKNDEFYTKYSTIEDEVKHYKSQPKDKVIYCNCDDYRRSNFVKYFKDNFEELGIKKLYATHYINQSRNLFNLTQYVEKPKFYQYDGKTEKISELRGDGDFRSEECLEILKKSDIVITNPPFSLVRKLILLIVGNNKDMLIVATTGIIAYRDTFHLLKDEKIRQGYLFNKCLEVEVPKSTREVRGEKVS